jgi:18S rRNA (guanine1575-N7)-methyltransferase
LGLVDRYLRVSKETLEGVENEEKVKFEKRRERAKARSSVKKKNVKGRDWVLKKKEVM